MKGKKRSGALNPILEKRKKAARQKTNFAKNSTRSIVSTPTYDEMETLISLYNDSEFGKAEILATSFVEKFPLHHVSWKVLGAIFNKTGRLTAALSAMSKAVDLDPNDESAHNNLGVTLQELGRFDDSEKALRQAISINPNYAEALSNLSRTLNARAEYTESCLVCKRAVNLKPDFAAAHCNLGNAYAGLGEVDNAIESFRRSVEIDPGSVIALTNLGNSLTDAGEFAAAVLVQERAVALKPEYAPAHNNLGNALFELDRLEEAVSHYSTALSLKDDYADASSNLGKALEQLGKLGDAILYYERVLELRPGSAADHINLGRVLEKSNERDKAELCFKRAILQDPNSSSAHSSLGNILADRGLLNEALDFHRTALELAPNSAAVSTNYGVVLAKLGLLSEARASHMRAILLNDRLGEAHTNLGNLLHEQGELLESEASHARAIALHPDRPEFYYNMGNTLKSMNRLAEAERTFRVAVRLNPTFDEALSNLGLVLYELGDLENAEKYCLRAVNLNPVYTQAHNNLGVIQTALGKYKSAVSSYEHAIRIDPDYAIAYANLGNALAPQNKLEEASAAYKKAILIDPSYRDAHHSLLFASNYDHRLSAIDLYKEYEAYGKGLSHNVKRFDHSKRTRPRGRRIRIGYSSPDFRNHACRFFMEPIFRNHNSEEFELFAYSNTLRTDEFTIRLKNYFDNWIDVLTLSDEELARRIYDDQIDILVDMAGHSKGNRLDCFAMKPAPLQLASPIGCGYTTGLNEMDYFIADENLVPKGSSAFFSEQICYLQSPYIAYDPPKEQVPDVSEPPVLRNGYITFGSLSRIIRINDPVLRVWSKILELVPSSRLRLDQRPFANLETKEMFLSRLDGVGIARERVDLVCSDLHWNGYHEIDITLDTWPHNSGTTILESLIMGVPVLTKADRVSVGRIGASLLDPLGLEDWIAESEESYIHKAVNFASDLGLLTKLRSALRHRVYSSPILDAKGLTKKLEDAYKKILKDYEEKE